MSKAVQEQFVRAVAFHQQGKLQEAQSLYQSVLKLQPKHADALHLLGVIYQQAGQADRAVQLIGQAITLNPKEVGYCINRGNALQSLGRLEEAVASFEQAIRLRPSIPEAHFNLGNALQGLDKLDAALSSFNQAIRLKPDYADAYNNLGRVQQSLQQLDQALESYDQAIRHVPNHAQAWNNRGLVLKAQGHHQSAKESFERALQLRPNYAEAWKNHGDVLLDLQQPQAAVESFDRALHFKPQYAEAYNNRGNALLMLNRAEAAFASYEQSIEVRPDYPEAWSNRGNALQQLKQYHLAIESYDRALQFNPDYPEAWNNRGNAQLAIIRLDDAVKSYEQALRIRPNYNYLRGILFYSRMRQCDWNGYSEHVSNLKAATFLAEKCAHAFTVVTLIDDLSVQYQSAITWSLDKHPARSDLGEIAKRPHSEKIRIGYYSADLQNHATAWLMAELFERHDRNRFELFAFSFGPPRQDEMRQRLTAAFDHFLDVRDKSDLEVAAMSRALDIDIAIDLKGYTQDSRPGIFSYRAAPIQVNYLGYPGTMGASYMDYLIADPVLIPEESRQYYSEKIVYLPDSYQVNDRYRKISDRVFTRSEVGLPEAGFVFCCFNNNYKMTPAMFDSWIRILNAVPDSVLWLYEENPLAADHLRKEAQVRGLNPSRLVFAKQMALPDHLARHRLADLFLDTVPCNAHTTASDALWAGLPVLTRMGESLAARVAASLLAAIGLPELITEKVEQYEALAIELATHPAKLKAIQAKLEYNRLTAPLFDTGRYTQHLEAAFVQMVERSQADQPPDHLLINPLPMHR